jgi:hypothetical protein
VKKGVRVRVTDPHVGHVDLLIPEKLVLRNVFRSLSKPKERGLKPKAFGVGKKVPRKIPPLDFEIGMAAVVTRKRELVPNAWDIPFFFAGR